MSNKIHVGRGRRIELSGLAQGSATSLPLTFDYPPNSVLVTSNFTGDAGSSLLDLYAMDEAQNVLGQAHGPVGEPLSVSLGEATATWLLEVQIADGTGPLDLVLKVSASYLDES